MQGTQHLQNGLRTGSEMLKAVSAVTLHEVLKPNFLDVVCNGIGERAGDVDAVPHFNPGIYLARMRAELIQSFDMVQESHSYSRMRSKQGPVLSRR